MARIYVADLAAYNAGSLHGKWIDLGQFADEEDLLAEIQANVLLPYHEEWAIHDYEGFGPIKVSEYEALHNVIAHSQALDQLSESEHAPFAVFISDVVGSLDYFNGDALAAVDEFHDRYLGEMSMLDYAYKLVEETDMLRGVSETVAHYFDYEAFARDLEMEMYYVQGYIFESN